MFKSIRKIENVYRCFCDENTIYILRDKEDEQGELLRISTNESFEDEVYNFSVYIQNIFFGKKVVLLKNGNSEGILFFPENKEIIDLPKSFMIGDSFLIEDTIVVYKGMLSEKEFGIYSLSEKAVLWMNKYRLKSYGEKVFGELDYVFYRFKPLTGEIIWKLDLKTKYPELENLRGAPSFIGVNSEILLLGFRSIDKLLAIDINHGELKWEKSSLVDYFLLENETNKLHLITAAYQCFDIETGNIINEFYNIPYFENTGVFSQRNNYVKVGDHIITTDYRKGVIGAFNTITHEFDWVHKEEGISFPGAFPMRYCDPFLFVLDNKERLHVFEKE